MIPWTTEELRARAEKDLLTRPLGCLLDWAFLQAEASGALAAAKEWLAFNMDRYRDLKSTLTGNWAPPDDSVRSKDLYRQLVELEVACSSARGEMAFAQQCVCITERVLELLQRPRAARPVAAPATVAVIKGGKAA